MKRANRIEELIPELRYKAGSAMHTRVLDSILQIFEESRKAGASTTQVRPWRAITMSRIARLGAAVLIILSLMAGIHFFGTSPIASSAVFAKMTKSLESVPWMYAKHEFVRGSQSSVLETWNCFETGMEAEKESTGRATVWDYQKHRKFVYNPRTNTIVITHLSGNGFTKGSSGPLDLINNLVEIAKSKGAAFTHSKGTHEGCDVHIYVLTQSKGGLIHESTLKIDMQTYLPASLQVLSKNPHGQVVTHIQGNYEFPREGPKDIYDLGVPESAQIMRK